MAGDVAPQGARDNVLNNNDIVIIQKFISGEVVPTSTEKKLSDVHPVSSPNNIIDSNDVNLLSQAIAGQVTIPPIELAAPPILNALGFTTTINNPIPVSGTAAANATVEIYSNGVFQASTTAAADGTFTVNTPLFDGDNSLYAVSISGADVSSYSSALDVSYSNTISRVQSGSISGNIVWTPGVPAQPYSITGADLVIPVGSSLVIQPGTELQFASGRKLSVDGTLIVRGNHTNKVKLRGPSATPTRGAWAGITINGTATNMLIENAIIESAVRAIYSNGAPVRIKDSSISYFSSSGIRIVGLNANGSVIQANTIDNVNNTVNCIELDATSPSVIGNTLTNCSAGLYITGNASPVVNGNNIITSNVYGVQLGSSVLTTLPVITGNQIFANTTNNYRAVSYPAGAQNLVLNATGNWWGTTDATSISNTILDLTDSPAVTTRPSVNYGNFLDAANGTAVAGNYLIGAFTSTSTTFVTNTTYNILGITVVPPGKSLIIPEGVTLKFALGSQLIIEGSLSVSGTTSNPVYFTTTNINPAASNWRGLLIRPGATAVNIQNAVIQYADRGLQIDNTATVVNVTDSLIQLCDIGVYINGNTNPVIEKSRIVTNANYGIYINGTANNATDPKPVLNNNDIYNHSSTSRNIYIANYSTSPTVKIDATNNWWGTVAPVFSQASMLNTAPVLTAPGLAPIATTHSIANVFFSPNADTVQDVSTLVATLSETASWALDIKNGTTIVKSYSGSGTSINSVWDGNNSTATTQADGRYSIVLTANSGARTGVVLYREVILDNTAPIAGLDPLLTSLIQRNLLTVPVIGTAKDLNFFNYTVDYTNNLSPVIYNPIATNVPVSITNASLNNWVVGTTLGGTVVPNGMYILRVTVKDLAGNQAVVTAPVTIDNLSLTNVSVSNSISFSSNTSAPINFLMSVAGTVTIKIYDVNLGTNSTPLRTFSAAGVAGANTVSWDGKDQAGNNVPGSAYLFVIEASDGTRMGRYDTSSVVYSMPATFQQINTKCDAYRNIFSSVNVTTPQPGLAGLQLTTPNGVIYPYGQMGTPVLAGTTTLYWDCRDPLTGALATFPATSLAAFTTFPVNTILIDTVYKPAKVKGVGANIEVKSDPYLVYLSYGQFTKIAYNLQLAGVTSAQVDIKLLPPLVLDFDDPSAINVFSGVRGAGDHEVTWKGLLTGPENAKRSLGSAEGAYTFAIKTTADGVTSLYRGTLSVYQ